MGVGQLLAPLPKDHLIVVRRGSPAATRPPLPGQTVGLAAPGSDGLILAQRDDLLAGERGTTTIVDARDLR